MKRYAVLICLLMTPVVLFTQTVIGITSVDNQSPASSKRRIIVHDDGTISCLFEGSIQFTDGSIFTDGGMFYNYFDGLEWGELPEVRIESYKTGGGEIIRVEDHEVVVSHDNLLPRHIVLYANSEVGGTDWEELDVSGENNGFGPMAECPEGTDDIYVIAANAPTITNLYFSRSDDGGMTWTVDNSVLPFLTDADGMPDLMGDGFLAAAQTWQLAVHGSNVYVLFGMVNSDLVLIHSNDYGNDGTWTKTLIHDFPIDAYNGFTQTDINGDLITDTLATTDGHHDMFVSDDGTLYVFSGYARIYNDGMGDHWTHQYNDAMNMWFWKTGMPAATPINLTLDWDNTDGLNDPVAGIQLYDWVYRFPGIISTPAAAIDESTGHLYLTYTMPIEYTNNYDDEGYFYPDHSNRDIFGVFSNDGGETWSSPINFTNTAEAGLENYFPSTFAKVVDGKVHTVWQRDAMPGTTVTANHEIDTNEIIYAGWPIEKFGDSTVIIENIDHGTQDLDFILAPNPTTGNFSIQLSGLMLFDAQIRISNAVGQIIMTRLFEILNEGETEQIDLSTMPPGIYQVTIHSGNAHLTNTLVIE